MLKVLIADGAEEFCHCLAESLQGQYMIRTSHEGKHTLELLGSFAPDLLVLDLMLPGLDGVTLLQQAYESGKCPVVLAITRYVNDYIIGAVQRFGVEYVMVKPCDMRALVMRIGDLLSPVCRDGAAAPDERSTASEILISLGIATNRNGYFCLQEALIRYMRDPLQAVTKELYPAVAAVCGGNGEQVERSIRIAIEAAWKRRNDSVWCRYFHADADGNIRKPTNSAFISRLAAHIKMNSCDGESTARGMVFEA